MNCKDYMTRVAGTLASSPDTPKVSGTNDYCHHIVCPANFYKSEGGGCVACATETYTIVVEMLE